jgi:hypothetical protein
MWYEGVMLYLDCNLISFMHFLVHPQQLPVHADQFNVPHDPLELLRVPVLVHVVHWGHGVHGLEPCGIDFWQSVEIGLGFLLKCRFSVGFGFGIEKSRRFLVVFPRFFGFFGGFLCCLHGHVTVTVMLPLCKDQFSVVPILVGFVF